jgi:hypothetical protein
MTLTIRYARQLYSILLIVGLVSIIAQGFTAGSLEDVNFTLKPEFISPKDEINSSDFNPNGPIMNLTSPANNSFVSGIVAGPVPILIDVKPGTSASLDRNARILVSGTWYDMTDISNGHYSSFFYPWDLSGPAGPNKTVTITVFDSLNRNNTYVLNVTSDNELPDCHFLAPLNKDYLTQDIIIRVNASDTCSNICSASILFIDPFGITSQPIALLHVASEWRYTWLCKSNKWIMGKYQIILNASDGAGNCNSSKIEVTLDYTNPFLEIVSPLNQSVISRVQDIRLRIGDPVSSISNILMQLENGTALVLANTSFQDFYTRIDTMKIPDGLMKIRVIVTNLAGLINSTCLTYLIDNQKPNGVLLGSDQINDIARYMYVCNDSSSITRIAWHIDSGLLKDLPISPQGNISITTRNHRDGHHLLQLIIEDGASPVNRRTIQKAIIIDNTNPEVSVQNLAPGMLITPQHMIKIKVFDENAVTLSVSIDYGAFQVVPYDSQAGAWTISLSDKGLISGTHSITLVGRDITGNVDEDFYIFTLYHNPSLSEQVLDWFVKWGFIIISAVAAAIVIMIIVIKRKQKKPRGKVKARKIKR